MTCLLWIWNREQIGELSALDYLIKVCDMSFLEATETILNSSATLSEKCLSSNISSSREHDASSALTAVTYVILFIFCVEDW
ncbi:MAG: hypothetical protein FWD82_02735 [Defluviitaleaceae bacterium]|nr:hypothetical protein [Defluviitaleaceae bacterium]